MKILIIGFEPGRSLINMSHQIEMITNTYRDLAKATLKKTTEQDEKKPRTIPQVMTYVVDGGLNVITFLLAKAQIEMLNPDATLLLTDKSPDDLYRIARLATPSDDETFIDKNKEKRERKSLPFRMTQEAENFLDKTGNAPYKSNVEMFSVTNDFKYLHQLRCYCQGRIAWVDIPPPGNIHDSGNRPKLNRAANFVLGAYHGIVNYLEDWEKEVLTKPALASRTTSTDVNMIEKTMEGGLAMFNVKRGITEFVPRPFDYDDYDSVWSSQWGCWFDNEKELSDKKVAEEAEREKQLNLMREARKKEREERKRRREEEARKAQEDKAQADDEAKKTKQAEEEAKKRQAEEEERKRKQAEEEAKKQAEEEEAKKREEEEAKKHEEEKKKKQAAFVHTEDTFESMENEMDGSNLFDLEDEFVEESRVTEETRITEEATVAEIERLACEATTEEERNMLDQQLDLLLEGAELHDDSEDDEEEGVIDGGSDVDDYDLWSNGSDYSETLFEDETERLEEEELAEEGGEAQTGEGRTVGKLNLSQEETKDDQNAGRTVGKLNLSKDEKEDHQKNLRTVGKLNLPKEEKEKEEQKVLRKVGKLNMSNWEGDKNQQQGGTTRRGKKLRNNEMRSSTASGDGKRRKSRIQFNRRSSKDSVLEHRRYSVEFNPIAWKIELIANDEDSNNGSLRSSTTSVEFEPLRNKIDHMKQKLQKKHKQRRRKLSTDFFPIDQIVGEFDHTNNNQEQPQRQSIRNRVPPPVRRNFSVEFNPVGDRIKSLMEQNQKDKHRLPPNKRTRPKAVVRRIGTDEQAPQIRTAREAFGK